MKTSLNLSFGAKMRILVLSLMVSCFMACNTNAPDIPSEDRSVLNKASKNVVSVMGKDKYSAEKAFFKAGFRKLGEDMNAAPRRLLKVRKGVAYDDYDDYDEYADCYVYNITVGMEDMDDEEVVNAIIESKKTAIIFMTIYDENGKLSNINGKLIVGAEIDNVNKVYLDCSENLHKNITALGSWQGTVSESDEDSEQTEYTNFNKFYDAVYPMNSVFTTESAACALNLFGTKSFGYGLSWNKPNESKARWQINNEGYKTAIAEAAFSITYMEL